jgi:hypothetical protein
VDGGDSAGIHIRKNAPAIVSAGKPTDDERHNHDVHDLRVIREQRRQSGMADEPADRAVRLGARHREQHPQEEGGRGRRHYERNVTEEELVAAQVGIELLTRVRHAEVHRPVLGQAADQQRHERVDHRAAPSEISPRAPGEHDAEEGGAPAAEHRARSLAHQITKHA